MLTTRAVNILEHVDALWPLLHAHRNELATHPELMQLAPMLGTYHRIQEAGNLLALLLEHSDAGPVGYSVNIISQNLHYGDLRVCQNDVIYVTPSYRSEGGGRLLIDATEIAARELGCAMVLMHAKPDTRLDEVLPGYGYGVQDVIYSKVL